MWGCTALPAFRVESESSPSWHTLEVHYRDSFSSLAWTWEWCSLRISTTVSTLWEMLHKGMVEKLIPQYSMRWSWVLPLPQDHTHVQYFPVVHECKKYFNWFIVMCTENYFHTITWHSSLPGVRISWAMTLQVCPGQDGAEPEQSGCGSAER